MFVARLELAFWSEAINRVSRIRFDLDSVDQHQRSGKWKASDPAARELAMIYFGKADGVWDIDVRLKDGSSEGASRILTMREFTDSRGISALWTESAKVYASLADVGYMPFRVGRDGWGRTWMRPVWRFDWKVIHV